MPSFSRDVSRLASSDPEAPSRKQVVAIGISTLLLILASAVVFRLVEYEPARDRRHDYEQNLAELIRKGNFTTGQSQIVDQILALNGRHSCRSHMSGDDPWNFHSAIYFTLVLISTVGYGDLAPETPFGKLFAVIISLIGIPLFLAFYLPVSCWIVDKYTLMVRRWYISRAVERAMEAVQLHEESTSASGTRSTEELASSPSSFMRVDYSRRLPDHGGIGFSKKDIFKVELLSTTIILLILLAVILGIAPCLSHFQSWSLADALCFIWYTLTTIGLGDVTIEPLHPLVASLVLLVLLLLGSSTGRALVCSTQRAAALLEDHFSGAPSPVVSQVSEFAGALESLAGNQRRSSEELPASGQ